MTKPDEINYHVIRWIKTAAEGNHDQYLKDDAELRGSDIDPIDVVAALASAAASMIKNNPDWQAIIDRQLEEIDVIRRLGLGDDLERENHRKRRD